MNMRVLFRFSGGMLACTASFPGALALGHRLCAARLCTVAHLFPWNIPVLLQMSSQGLGALAASPGHLEWCSPPTSLTSWSIHPAPFFPTRVLCALAP